MIDIIHHRRGRRQRHRAIAMVLALGLLSVFVQASGGLAADAAASVKAPKPPAMPAVKAASGVFAVKARPAPKPADAAAVTAKPVGVAWPTAATGVVTLAADQARTTAASHAGVPGPDGSPGRRTAASGTPVWIEPGAGYQGSTSLSVSVADHTAAVRAGVDGVVFSVSPRQAAGRPADAAASSSPSQAKATIGLDYSGFADAYGGNYGSRLHLVQLPACALTTPQLAQCRKQSPVSGAANSAKSDTLSAPATLSATVVLAATADDSSTGSGGAAGTYSATSLKPSGTWSAGGSSGSFTYEYPISAPPSASPLAPSLDLSYDSGSVDGQTASTQAQAGWLGDGWSTPQSFIEQSFVSCSDSPEGTASPKATNDQCYDGPILMLSLNGTSTPLVWDAASGTYKAADDSGEVVRHVTGSGNGSGTYNTDWWQVTERTGTVYMFGRNELPGWSAGDPTTNSVDSEPVFSAHAGDPCYDTTGFGFAQSVCTMGYRWNLDYVKDLHGDAMSYYYDQDTNSYAENADTSGTTTPTATATYVRDSHLDHIDYGFADGAAYTVNGGHAPDQVQFTTGDRCLTGTCDPLDTADAPNWSDVPYDLHCDPGKTCYSTSPSNWSTVRLTGIKTQQWNGAAYAPVDSWSFTQTMPATGDGTSPTLWLSSITRTGADTTAGGAAVALPPVTFTAVALANRVDTSTLPALTRMRISSVTTETGSVIGVNYSLTNPCSAPVTINPAANTSSCYPIYWTPKDNLQPLRDWFEKYQVASVSQSDPSGGAPALLTSYSYLGGGAWHYDDNELVKAKYRTYGQWRGFGEVQTFTGQGGDARTESQAVYYRGMSKDDSSTVVDLTDSQGGVHEDADQLAGDVLESTGYDFAGGPITDSMIASYWISPATATRTRTGLPDLTANATGLVETWSRKALTDGGATTWRQTETDTAFDAVPTSPTFGMPLFVYSHGDLSDPTQQQCTATTYAPANTAINLAGLPAEVETLARPCGGADPNGATVPTSGQINTLTAPATVNRPADVVLDERTFYDAPTLASTWPQPTTVAWPQPAPTRGDVSEVRVANGYANGAYTYQVKSAALYDSYGTETTSYDPLGRMTSTQPTLANGVVTAVKTTNPLGQSATTTLDPLRGVPVGSVDANGVSSTSHLDGLGRVVAVWASGRPVSAPANGLISYQLTSTGPPVVTVQKLNDSLGYSTSTTLYDALLRSRQTQTPTPDGGRLVTDTFYDSRGWAWKTNAGWWDSATTPNGTLAGVPDSQVPDQEVTAFDGDGRAVLTTSYGDSQIKLKTATAYDLAAAGGGDETVSVKLDATGVPLTGSTTTADVTDALGRTVEQDEYTAAPSVNVTTSAATAPITTVSITGGTAQATKYVFDAAGRQTDVVDVSTGADWHSTLDLLGRPVSENDPDAGTSTSVYDAAGQVSQTTDARGRTISYTYDALGRKTGEYAAPVSGQAPANQLASWVFDNSDNAVPGMSDPIGNLTTETSYQGGSGSGGSAYVVQSRGFNVFGESLGQTVTLPASEGALAGSYTFTDKYTANTGLPLQSSFPASPGGGSLPAETLTHGYAGALDMPVSLTGLPGYYAQNTSYTAYSQVGQEQLGTSPTNAAYLTDTYDPHTGALTDTQLTHPSAGPTPIDDTSYTYDPAGNPTSQTDTRQGVASETQCFAYDNLDRLTQAWTATDSCAASPAANGGATVGDGVTGSAYWTSWTLNPLGLRQSETDHGLGGQANTVTSYSYPSASGTQPHSLTSTSTTGPAGSSSTSYGYDAAGNTTTRTTPSQGTQTLSWTADGELAGVTGGTSGNSSYVYLADGTLLLQRDPGQTTLYLPGEQLALKTATSSVTGTRFYALPGGGTAVRTGTSYGYELTDQRGTAVLSIDSAFTTPTWRQETPYGAPRGTAPASWPDPNGFLGKTQDTDTGLVEVGSRWYDPAAGRFVSVDPVMQSTDSQQQNGYTYAGANPITFSDPSGMTRCDVGVCPTPYQDTHGSNYCDTHNCNSAGGHYNGPNWADPDNNPYSGGSGHYNPDLYNRFSDYLRNNPDVARALAQRTLELRLAEERAAAKRVEIQAKVAEAGHAGWSVFGWSPHVPDLGGIADALKPRMPDYVTVNLSYFYIGGGGLVLTVTRDGHVYAGPEVGVGMGPGLGIRPGWIGGPWSHEDPDHKDIDKFVAGGSGTIQAFGAGETWGRSGHGSRNFATEFGAGGGPSVTGSYMWRLPWNSPIRW